MELSRKLTVAFSLLAGVMLSTTPARAQLSTSVGGSMSLPLDSNLDGLDSTVAPVPSGEIEPGANSLMIPDERVLPYDAIGASIAATPMSPAVTQVYTLTRDLYQIDNALRDETIITGLHSPPPVKIIDAIPRNLRRSGASAPVASFGNSSMFFTGSSKEKTLGITDNLQGSIPQQSSWKVGAAAAALAVNPIQTSQEEAQQSGSSLTTKENSGNLLKKKKTQGEKTESNRQSTEQPHDYSTNPLEAPAYGDQNAETTTSPLERQYQSSYLNPDITLASRHSAVGKTSQKESAATLFSAQRQSGIQASSGILTGRNQGISRTKSRAMKSSSLKAEQPTKIRWHNPILQQMEDEANSPNPQ
jgi:hypothetical protein